ncbi:MAG: DUF3343 domain-containing protein [Clostridia bacterium]|nr:DUF3343 domain-containing protein [Clostridia bacterium]
MKKYVAVFRSGTDVQSFIEDMKAKYAYAKTVPTPKQLRLGCGRSAEFNAQFITLAKKLILSGKYSSFYTLVLIEKQGSRTVSMKI